MAADLDANWEVLAEPIQTVMRRRHEKPYEAQRVTRGRRATPARMRTFIDTWLPEAVKVELKKLTPANYIGDAQRLVDLLE
jgi:adenylosuccinate lyase